MKVRGADGRDEKPQLQMTPMIDIVFQLLVFFIMTFQIVIPEGDFIIKMPASAPQAGPPPEQEAKLIRIKMTSDENGKLTRMTLDGSPVSGGFEELHNHIIGIVGESSGPASGDSDPEVELDCDYDLDYRYVIATLTAVSGRKDGNTTHKLIEKIKLTPPKKK